MFRPAITVQPLNNTIACILRVYLTLILYQASPFIFFHHGRYVKIRSPLRIVQRPRQFTAPLCRQRLCNFGTYIFIRILPANSPAQSLSPRTNPRYDARSGSSKREVPSLLDIPALPIDRSGRRPKLPLRSMWTLCLIGCERAFVGWHSQAEILQVV